MTENKMSISRKKLNWLPILLTMHQLRPKKWRTLRFWKAMRQFEMIYPGRREAARGCLKDQRGESRLHKAIDTSRRNAQKSTGPGTTEGKSNSSRNNPGLSCARSLASSMAWSLL
jgi:hypothetical protein